MLVVLCVNLIDRGRSRRNTAGVDLSPLQLVPVTRIEKFRNKRGGLSTQGQLCQRCQERKVMLFPTSGEKAGPMEPGGPVPNRRKEEGWWEATEPYHGARPRATDFDRLVDIGLGATMGGLEEDVELRDSEVPRLPRKSKFSRRRRYRRHRVGNYVETKVNNRGTEDYDRRVAAGSGGPGGPAERYSWSEPTEQRMVTGGDIGRYSVSYAARSRGVTDGKPISEDAEGTSARAPGAPGGTYDDKGALV